MDPPGQDELLRVLQTEGPQALQELCERQRQAAREQDASKPFEPTAYMLDPLSGASSDGITGLPR
jgi:hypothetical protein